MNLKQQISIWLLTLIPTAFICADEKITYDDHAKPVFQKRCASCHNPSRQSGGLDLTNFTNLMQGGSSGESVEAGDADNSYLYSLITHEDSPEMPPSGKIPDAEIRVIESWINGGALENKVSVAVKKKVSLAAPTVAIGSRPDNVSIPLRMSLEPHFRTQTPGLIRSIATSPWASIAALAGPKQILIYDTRKLEYLGALPYPNGQANVLQFSQNGSLLVAGGGRHGLAGKVAAFDVQLTTLITEVGDELDNVLAADIHPDHSMIALGGPQKMLRIYSTTDGSLNHEKKKHTDWITAIKFSPDGVLVATADRSGGLQLWETDSGLEYLTLGGHSESITDLSWRGDGNLLASCGDDGAIRLWEVENGRQIKSWTAHAKSTSDIEFTRDGKIASCGRDSLAKLWQQDGKLVRKFEGLKEIGVAVSFCDETQRLIASDLSGHVAVWSAADGKLIKSLPTNPLTLKQRLRRLQGKLAQAQEALQPLQQEYQEVATTLSKLTEQLEEQKQTSFAKNKLAQQIQVKLGGTQADIDSLLTEQTNLQSELAEKEKQVPALNDAVTSALKASEMIPDDQTLKATADTLASKHEQWTNRVDAIRSSLAVSDQTLSDLQKIRVTIQTEVEKITNQFGAATKRIEELETEQQPLIEQKNSLSQKLDAAQKRVARFETQIQKWTAEESFHAAMLQKKAALHAAELEMAEQNESLAEAQKHLKAAQALFDTQQKRHSAAAKSVNEVQLEIQRLRSKK